MQLGHPTIAASFYYVQWWNHAKITRDPSEITPEHAVALVLLSWCGELSPSCVAILQLVFATEIVPKTSHDLLVPTDQGMDWYQRWPSIGYNDDVCTFLDLYQWIQCF